MHYNSNPRGHGRQSGHNYRQSSAFSTPPMFQQSLMPMPLSHGQGFNFPPLFVGNLGVESGSHAVDSIYEINFKDVCVLDALHIIPNNVCPPSLPKYIGKTRPDINARPFLMKMYVRNIESSTIVPVHEWTIQGGVQYLPLPPHVQSMYTDYVAFGGDFDIISIVIHGKRLSHQELAGKKLYALKFDPNISTDYNLQNIKNDASEVFDEDYDDMDDDEFTLKLKKMRHLLTTTTDSSTKKMTKHTLHRGDYLNSTFQNRYGGYQLAESYVIKSFMADLIEKVFSISLDNMNSYEDMEAKSNELSELATRIDNCWKSYQTYDKDSMDQISSIGDDTSTVLCQLLIQGLNLLRSDMPISFANHSVMDCSSSLSNKIVIQYALNLLICCRLVLANRFTSNSFYNAQGLSILGYLARQQPPLPNSLLALILDCLWQATSHLTLTVYMFEPPAVNIDEFGQVYNSQEMSGYQTLVYLLGSVKPSNVVIVEKILRLMDYGQFYDCCYQLQLFAQSMIATDINSLNEAISWRLGGHNSTSFDIFNHFERNIFLASNQNQNESYENILKHSNIALKVTHDRLVALQPIFQYFLMYLRKYVESDTLISSNFARTVMDLKLMELLDGLKVVPSLVTVFHFTTIAKEFCDLLSWHQRHYTGIDIKSLVSKCYDDLKITVMSLMMCSNIEILLTRNVESVRILHQLLCSHSNLLTCQSFQEISDHPHISSKCLSDTSIGWLSYLMVVVTGFVDKLVKELSEITEINENISILDANRIASNSNIQSLLVNLEEVMSNLAGYSIVMKVIKYYAIEPLIKVWKIILTSAMKESIDDIDRKNDYTLSKIILIMLLSTRNDRLKCQVKVNVNEENVSYEKDLKNIVASVSTSHLLTVSQTLPLFCKVQAVLGLFDFQLSNEQISSVISNLRSIDHESKLSSIVSVRCGVQYLLRFRKDESNEFHNHLVRYGLLICKWCRGSIRSCEIQNPIDYRVGNERNLSLDECLVVDDDIFSNMVPDFSSLSATIRAHMTLTALLESLLSIMQFLDDLSVSSIVLSPHGDLVELFVNALYVTHQLTSSSSANGMIARIVSAIIHKIFDNTLGVDKQANETDNSRKIEFSDVIKRLLVVAATTPSLLETVSHLMIRTFGRFNQRVETERLHAIINLIDASHFGKKNNSRDGSVIETSSLLHSLSETSPVVVEDAAILHKAVLSTLNSNITNQASVQVYTMLQLISVSSFAIEDQLNILSNLKAVVALESFAYVMVSSSSMSCHFKFVDLMMQTMSILSVDDASNVAKHFLETLRKTIDYQLSVKRLLNEKSSKIERKSVNIEETERESIRYLIILSILCENGKWCIFLIDQGLIGILIDLIDRCEDYSSDFTLIVLQCITSVFKTISYILASYQSEIKEIPEASNAQVSASSKGWFCNQLALVLDALHKLIVSHLPKVMIKLIETCSWQLIGQCSLLISLLPPAYIRLYVEHCTGTLASIEVLAVKLWLAVEESYQQLTEVTEVRKNILSLLGNPAVDTANLGQLYYTSSEKLPMALDDILSIDFCESLIVSAQQSFACAAYVLKIVLEVAYACYLRDILPLSSLSRAIRSSLSFDPRKLTLRMQRSYTMWANDYSSVQNIRNGVRGIGIPLKSNNIDDIRPNPSHSISLALPHSKPNLRVECDEDIPSNRYYSSDDTLFESSHYLSTTSLKQIADIVSKAIKYVVNREDKSSLLAGGDIDLEAIMQADFKTDTLQLQSIISQTTTTRYLDQFRTNVFTKCMSSKNGSDSEDNSLVVWLEKFSSVDVCDRKDTNDSCRSFIHQGLRKGIIQGDDSHPPLYDSCYYKVNANIIKSIASDPLKISPIVKQPYERRKLSEIMKSIPNPQLNVESASTIVNDNAHSIPPPQNESTFESIPVNNVIPKEPVEWTPHTYDVDPRREIANNYFYPEQQQWIDNQSASISNAQISQPYQDMSQYHTTGQYSVHNIFNVPDITTLNAPAYHQSNVPMDTFYPLSAQPVHDSNYQSYEWNQSINHQWTDVSGSYSGSNNVPLNQMQGNDIHLNAPFNTSNGSYDSNRPSDTTGRKRKSRFSS